MTRKTQRVKDHVLDNIHWQVYAEGARIPSVRDMARRLDVSPYTVTQAYDDLVAQGVIYARSGAGYFVSAKRLDTAAVSLPEMGTNVRDSSWLLSHLFSDVPQNRAPGSGLLPPDWLMPEAALRQATQKATQSLDYVYGYGLLQGHLGLREQFARQLHDINIKAHASLMLTSSGVCAGIELVVRAMCRHGDCVLIDDPGWYWIIGCLQNMGVTIITLPRQHERIDTDHLAQLLEHHRPRLYITNSVLHNPTGYNLNPNDAFHVLALMQRYDCYIVEDDIYRDFSSDPRLIRYATLSGFHDDSSRVFYLGGVSKVLGGNWRVGLICCPKVHLEAVMRQKMLSNMSCPEITERTIYHVLQSAAYHKHVTNLQTRLGKAHRHLRQQLGAFGLSACSDNGGLFVWVDVGVDSAELALAAHRDGWLVAPGSLFSPHTATTTHIRLNPTTTHNDFVDWLKCYILRCTKD